MGGEKQATILGCGLKTNAMFAALVNGTMSHALDFDDTQREWALEAVFLRSLRYIADF